MFKEEALLQKLKSISTAAELSVIQQQISEQTSWESLNLETKKEFVKAMERIHSCPQKYKDNPHIHYEVTRRKRLS